ncbi:hypothetical protein DSL72_007108 [Monilinia vaccinii-corymbosi]|uniref:C2H2-type domain-containing protein n=1 Tax=Monilinia vaccinii-corymbosi TaxID=61207 RepID=A0A8A3PMA7_9HELO|nr:hypothetical protein DSL72_007108 [Monilinia vaccinii-corymbosi]
MTNPSGDGGLFWSPDADETQYAYDHLARGTNIDTNGNETKVRKGWSGKTSMEFNYPPGTFDLSGDSMPCHSDNNGNRELIYSEAFSASDVGPFFLPPWDTLNDTLSLPDWDNLDNISSAPHPDIGGGSMAPLTSPKYSVEQTFQATSTGLVNVGAPLDPFQVIYNHPEPQAYETYSLASDPQLPRRDNANWDIMDRQSCISLPPPGIYLPSTSPAMQASTTSTVNSTSSPAQSPTTNIPNSTSQSTSNSNFTTASTNHLTSSRPLSPQNTYTCPICSKTFSKRFEFKYDPPLPSPNLLSIANLPSKHTPLHTLPQTCPLCPHRTARKRDMTRHIAAKHKDVDPSGSKPMEKPTCRLEGCGRVFARKDHMLRHLRKKHVGCKLN